MEILSVRDLRFSYPETGRTTLSGVSLTVRQGEFVCLCGPSGCGKTTLLRLLKRELAPFGEVSGQIFCFGQQQAELSEREEAQQIGFVMQNPESQIVTDKVWHELAFGLESLGLPNDEIRRRTGEIASYFGINRWFGKDTSQLSGGQKQLLNLASVMAMQPKILILDEPTSQLDPIGAADFIATLQKLNRDLGLTILLAEHRLEEVFPIADRAIVMDSGKILFDDTPEKVGELLRTHKEGERMLAGMPSAIRLFHQLGATGKCPLTVREGREFLLASYQNDKVRFLEETDLADGENAVTVKESWFRYERDLPDVLKGVFLTAQKGEVLAVLGENGSGKSTLLKVLSGQEKAYRGKLLIFGKKIGEYKNGSLYRHNVALLPQNPQTIFLEETVREDFNEVIKAMGYEKQEAEAFIADLTKRLEISHLLEQHPYDLSGGEQQRAALCKVLLLRPRLLLLDEPTKGIDAFAKRSFAELVRRLCREEGITVIMVTHDVEFAALCADRCAMLFDGQIIGESTPRRFFATNTFYTTAASRMSRVLYDNAVTVEDVAALCRQNGEKRA